MKQLSIYNLQCNQHLLNSWRRQKPPILNQNQHSRLNVILVNKQKISLYSFALLLGVLGRQAPVAVVVLSNKGKLCEPKQFINVEPQLRTIDNRTHYKTKDNEALIR